MATMVSGGFTVTVTLWPGHCHIQTQARARRHTPWHSYIRIFSSSEFQLHPEIEYKKAKFQHNLYQECGFLYLISGVYRYLPFIVNSLRQGERLSSRCSTARRPGPRFLPRFLLTLTVAAPCPAGRPEGPGPRFLLALTSAGPWPAGRREGRGPCSRRLEQQSPSPTRAAP